MADRIAVVQHHPVEGVGAIGAWARRRGVALDIHRGDLGDLPAEPSACILLGGPASVLAPPEWLRAEQAWLRERIAGGTRFLGICLGSQLLAHALGARVFPLPEAETGWVPIRRSDGSTLEVLQWHEDAFTLPPGADRIAESPHGGCQMFATTDGHVAMQFHPEWDAALVDAINDHFGPASPLPRRPRDERFERIATWFGALLDAWSAAR